jgi:hypothetical protein
MTQLKRLLSSVASAFVLSVSQFISIVIQFALSQKIKILFRFLINMPNLGFTNIAKHLSYLTKLISNECSMLCVISSTFIIIWHDKRSLKTRFRQNLQRKQNSRITGSKVTASNPPLCSNVKNWYGEILMRLRALELWRSHRNYNPRMPTRGFWSINFICWDTSASNSWTYALLSTYGT